MKKILVLLLVTIFTSTAFAQVVAPPTQEDYEKVFTRVEKEATFPGGLEGWKRYLEKNLRAELAAKYIKLKKRELSAKQTVYVQFKVDKEGKISEVRAINNTNQTPVHPALIEEAVRVIKEGPNWIPAEQNNKKVTYQAIQNITFMVAR